MPPVNQPRHMVVIGAGIVGVCAALYLQRDGNRVTIIDPRQPGEGASMGNANVIAVESCVPVATPGILRRVPKMMLDPLSPLVVRWSYLPWLAPWLWQFAMASRPAQVENISIALASLLGQVMADYRPLIEGAGVADMFHPTGMLAVFESEARFAGYQLDLDLQQRRGVKAEVLSADQVRQMEPALAPIFRHGVFYPDNWQTTNSFRLVQALAADLVRRGGAIVKSEARGFGFGPGGVHMVVTADGAVPCDGVVVAAGAWSKALAGALGESVMLDTERGYHVMLPNPGVSPRRPIYAADGGFVTTPLEDGLRFAGTVELGGLAAAPNYARADVLLRQGRRMLPGLVETGRSDWMGFRPSLPDSVPVIGRARRWGDAYLAFGHGHLGLTLAATTGRIVADLAAGRDPGLDLRPFRPDRF